jgi:hypothetical protein
MGKNCVNKKIKKSDNWLQLHPPASAYALIMHEGSSRFHFFCVVHSVVILKY